MTAFVDEQVSCSCTTNLSCIHPPVITSLWDDAILLYAKVPSGLELWCSQSTRVSAIHGCFIAPDSLTHTMLDTRRRRVCPASFPIEYFYLVVCPFPSISPRLPPLPITPIYPCKYALSHAKAGYSPNLLQSNTSRNNFQLVASNRSLQIRDSMEYVK